MTAFARALGATGGVLCAAAVGLSAWASHGLAGTDAQRIGLAALFAFGHGLALLLLTPGATRPRLVALSMLALGLLLFAGSLVAAVVAQASTALAPVGGWALMIGWLLLAADALRRR